MALKPSINVVGILHVHTNGIILGHGKIVIIIARFAAIIGDVYTSVAAHKNSVGILLIDPQRPDIAKGAGEHLFRRPVDIGPCAPAVVGTGQTYGGHKDFLVVIGIDSDLIEGIGRFSSHIVINRIHLGPCFPRIIRPVNLSSNLAVLRFSP